MRHACSSLALACLLGFSTLDAPAADAALALPAKKQTQLGLYMSVEEAFQTKQTQGAKVLFVDVRTPEEFEYVGHADVVDANIPYMKTDYAEWNSAKSEYAMVPNSNFLVAMQELLSKRHLDKSATIILMCRSGDRSAVAANLMAKAGFTRIYSVPDGFEGDMAKSGKHAGKRMVNGWKNAGLPWSYKLDKAKAYME